MESKFKEKDKVKIIKYGHTAWVHKSEWQKYLDAGFTFDQKPKHLLGEYPTETDDIIYWYDTMPELVGKEGVVDEVSLVQGKYEYSLTNISGKLAWYDEGQLELV